MYSHVYNSICRTCESIGPPSTLAIESLSHLSSVISLCSTTRVLDLSFHSWNYGSSERSLFLSIARPNPSINRSTPMSSHVAIVRPTDLSTHRSIYHPNHSIYRAIYPSIFGSLTRHLSIYLSNLLIYSALKMFEDRSAYVTFCRN